MEYLHLLSAPVHGQKSNVCNVNASIPIFGSNPGVTEGCDHLGMYEWSLLNELPASPYVLIDNCLQHSCNR